MRSISLAIIQRAEPYSVPNVPSNADFAKAIEDRRKQLHAITAKLKAGEITPVDWAETMLASLTDGHTTGAYYGRLLAIQEIADAADIDFTRGQTAADIEFEYLNGFLDALENKDPRYWDEELGEWRADAIARRQDAYLGKMRGTANSAFLADSNENDLFDWRLGGSEENCAECPEYAAMGAMARDDWPTVPGNADTPCLYNCNCSLVRADGISGFAPVTF